MTSDFATTRSELHRVAAHVLARRRQDVSGRFGLRSTPGGVGTPAFGDGPDVVRIAGGVLICEAGKVTRARALSGASLRELAELAGTDVDRSIDVGSDTPPLDDPDRPIAVADEHLATIANWYRQAWEVLDQIVASLGPDATPSVLQIWPEHFDAAIDVEVNGRRVNLGASPGDAWEPEPYLYVGPWEADRPGDPAYWNAPFGAVRRAADVDGPSTAHEFFGTGLSQLRS